MSPSSSGRSWSFANGTRAGAGSMLSLRVRPTPPSDFATFAVALRSRLTMAKRATHWTRDPATLIVLATVGMIGLLVARRHGVLPALRTVNRALGIVRVVRTP